MRSPVAKLTPNPTIPRWFTNFGPNMQMPPFRVHFFLTFRIMLNDFILGKPVMVHLERNGSGMPIFPDIDLMTSAPPMVLETLKSYVTELWGT